MSIIKGAQSYYRLFGLKGIFLVAKARMSEKPIEISVTIEGITHPVHLRLRTTDVSIFEEIIVNAEYFFEPSRSPGIIVDAGANIGLTSVYFANKFPYAKIIAIEPEEENFKMLKKNADYYSNIFPIQGALWKESAMLNLSNPGTGSWGYQTCGQQECDGTEGNVIGMTVDKLMEQYGCNYIDILKIDIEGSEKEVFETSAPWIDRVGIIIVELHDHFKTGCSRSVYRATPDFVQEWRKGETTFLARKDYVPLEMVQAFGENSLPATVNDQDLRIGTISIRSS